MPQRELRESDTTFRISRIGDRTKMTWGDTAVHLVAVVMAESSLGRFLQNQGTEHLIGVLVLLIIKRKWNELSQPLL